MNTDVLDLVIHDGWFLISVFSILFIGILSMILILHDIYQFIRETFPYMTVYYECDDIEHDIIISIATDLKAIHMRKNHGWLDDKSYYFFVRDGYLCVRYNAVSPRFYAEQSIIRFDLSDPNVVKKIKGWHDHRVMKQKNHS